MSDKVYCRDCAHFNDGIFAGLCEAASTRGNWYSPDVLVEPVLCSDKNAYNDCSDFAVLAPDDLPVNLPDPERSRFADWIRSLRVRHD